MMHGFDWSKWRHGTPAEQMSLPPPRLPVNQLARSKGRVISADPRAAADLGHRRYEVNPTLPSRATPRQRHSDLTAHWRQDRHPFEPNGHEWLLTGVVSGAKAKQTLLPCGAPPPTGHHPSAYHHRRPSPMQHP
jgi:hypothetical protein